MRTKEEVLIHPMHEGQIVVDCDANLAAKREAQTRTCPAQGRRAMCRPGRNHRVIGSRTGYGDGENGPDREAHRKVFLSPDPWNSFLLRCPIGNKS